MRQISDPKKIEDKSFAIIEKLLTGSKMNLQKKAVVKRVIHATTDLCYARGLSFHPKAIDSGLSALRRGRSVICDVGMVEAGINKRTLSSLGGKVICLINDKDVIKQSTELKLARAILAMRKASKFMNGAVISIGNAPTALFEVCDLVKREKIKPALIIGIPVGFVGAADSKKLLRTIGIPYITNSGTKGGSSVACAITNALLKLARGDR